MTLSRLLIATHNDGKLVEFRDLLAPYGVEVVSSRELNLPEPVETGDTFTANAILKAETASQAAGLPALADDSGLCVDALGGAPGIFSARWGGPTKDFAGAMARIEGALRERDCLEPPQRTGSFVAVLALAEPGRPTRTFEGRIDGTLVWPPRGEQGFGYDPMFCPEGHTRTFGEMSAHEKHGLPADGSLALSHRARAFQAFARAELA